MPIECIVLTYTLLFFILSLVKTAFSGVGLELMGGSQRLKNLKAREVLAQKGLLKTARPDSQIYEDLYANANAECDRLIAEQSRLDTKEASQRRQWNKLQKQMYADPKDLENFDPSCSYMAEFQQMTIVALIPLTL